MIDFTAFWAVWAPPLPFVAISAVGLWLCRKRDLNGSMWAAAGFLSALLASLSKVGVAFAQVSARVSYLNGESLAGNSNLVVLAAWNAATYVFSLVALVMLLRAVLAGRRPRSGA